ncbi:hypothetical protein LEP1GSC108_3371 [Leptospira weilii str. UI 13098]|uniref:Uncharacterized protein n=2 Tax=Leptospira weilii TaxID=28184 RepID=M6QP32_9LEPT|nr:hypothetical protein LEP1GSC108_3371 [Leptospira weilii str. UI 13098]
MNKRIVIISLIQISLFFLFFYYGRIFYIERNYSKLVDGYFNFASSMNDQLVQNIEDGEIIKSIKENLKFEDIGIYITDKKRHLQLIQGQMNLNKEDIEKELQKDGKELFVASRAGIIFLENGGEKYFIVSVIVKDRLHVASIVKKSNVLNLFFYHSVFAFLFILIGLLNIFFWSKNKKSKFV